MTFTPGNIRWIKNTTNHLDPQVGAYMEHPSGTFNLRFPLDAHGNPPITNASNPPQGELILLRQMIKGIAHFSHLVTPIVDQAVPVLPGEDPYPGAFRQVKTVAFAGAQLPVSATGWADVTRWGGMNMGNAICLAHVTAIGDLGPRQEQIWEAFAPYWVV